MTRCLHYQGCGGVKGLAGGALGLAGGALGLTGSVCPQGPAGVSGHWGLVEGVGDVGGHQGCIGGLAGSVGAWASGDIVGS